MAEALGSTLGGPIGDTARGASQRPAKFAAAKAIRALDLSHNGIGPAGASALAALALTTGLTSLDVSYQVLL